jgi:hypothetical protein
MDVYQNLRHLKSEHFTLLVSKNFLELIRHLKLFLAWTNKMGLYLGFSNIQHPSLHWVIGGSALIIV